MTKSRPSLEARLAELEANKADAERLHREATLKLVKSETTSEEVRARREAVQAIDDEIAGIKEAMRIEAERELDTAELKRQAARKAAYDACDAKLKSRYEKAVAFVEAIQAAANILDEYLRESKEAIDLVAPHLNGSDRATLNESLCPRGFNGDADLIYRVLVDAGLVGNGSMGFASDRDFLEWARVRNGTVYDLIAKLRPSEE